MTNMAMRHPADIGKYLRQSPEFLTVDHGGAVAAEIAREMESLLEAVRRLPAETPLAGRGKNTPKTCDLESV
jgi:hypothetical protein